MIRLSVAVLALGALAACGGGTSNSSRVNSVTSAIGGAGPRVLFAQGPISQACLRAGRKGASRAHCGCVQAVADLRLTSSDQRRGAAFFQDPHLAQETRQSDNPSSERFWLRWKAYGQDAARMCG